jgi:hypothetical protein
MEKTVVYGDVSVTVKRQTVLIKARQDAIIGKTAGAFNLLCKELGEDSVVVDRALTAYARISAQSIRHDNLPFEMLSPTDTLDGLTVKCRAYLTSEDIDPGIVDAIIEAIDDVNAAWGTVGEKKAKTTPAPSSDTGSGSVATS